MFLGMHLILSTQFFLDHVVQYATKNVIYIRVYFDRSAIFMQTSSTHMTACIVTCHKYKQQ